MVTTPLNLTRPWRNDPARYGRVSQAFHWTVALLIVAAVALGLSLGNWPRGHPTRESVIMIHKSIGLIIIGLAIMRLSWLLRSPAPPAAASLSTWQRRGARVVHNLLYALMFALPISGIVLSQAAGKEVTLFDWLTLPTFVSHDPTVPITQRPLVIACEILHTVVFKFALFAAITLHLAGSLKHALIDREPAMLRRMWGR